MTGELSFDTKLYFYPTVVQPVAGGRSIAISTRSANWIVLDNDMELEIFRKLHEGQSVGEVVDQFGDASGQSMDSFQRVLAKLVAREFAGITHLPEIKRIEGFRMLNIYVTNSCNLRCPHCFMNAGIAMKRELGLGDLKRILTDFRENEGAFVTFTGGEPKMRDDFMELLQFSKEIGLTNTVLTNGLLWSDEDIEVASGMIDEIQISIDGVDDKTNSNIRGKGHFEKAVQTAKKFAGTGTKVSIATTFAKEDLDTDIIPKYLKLKGDIENVSKGEISFKFRKKILPGRGLIPSESDNQEYMDKIRAIEEAVRPNANIENFMLGHEPNVISRNCGLGGISVRADGHVFFCNRVHEVDDYGYIFSRDMAEWIKIGKEINEKTSVDNVEPCRSCYLKNICNGGCRIDDYSNRGRTLDTPGPWVRVACTEEKKARLIEKMVKVFDTYYDFSQ